MVSRGKWQLRWNCFALASLAYRKIQTTVKNTAAPKHFYSLDDLRGLAALGLDQSIFSTLSSLVLFFAVLIALSLASHKFFERPVQDFLRKKLLPP